MSAARIGSLLAALIVLPCRAEAPPFDARRAWAEFSELVRIGYAYFDRAGVDGPAILGAFEPAALAAPNAPAFIDVLQTLGRNFADPHVVIGPLGAEDPAVIPTASDLYAAHRDGHFTILDVREGSDAAVQGIRPGADVTAIAGERPEDAIARLLGRPFASLSPAQVDFALNVALAGQRGRPRTLTVAGGARTLQATKALADAVALRPHLAVEREGAIAVIRVNNSLGDRAVVHEFERALTTVLDSPVLVLDLRNTPSGGNTTVARAIMGHFVREERPYQVHVVPAEERQYGVRRKFVEYVMPLAPFYSGRVFVIGGRWTGSMGEGLVIGLDALGATTVGSPLAHLLGGIQNVHLDACGALVDLPVEQLFHVDGTPREAFRPTLVVEPCERTAERDPALEAIRAAVR